MNWGKIILTIWFGCNFILALSIVIGLSLFHINAPALTVYFERSFIESSDPSLISLVNTMAVLLNAVITAYCGTVLIILWKKTFFKEKALFLSVTSSALFIQIFGFVSDSFMNHQNLYANLVSTLILLIGIAFCLRSRAELANQGKK